MQEESSGPLELKENVQQAHEAAFLLEALVSDGLWGKVASFSL